MKQLEDTNMEDGYLSEAPPWFKEFLKIQAKQFDSLKEEVTSIKGVIDQARIEAQDARRAAEEVQEKMEDVEMQVEGIRNDLEDLYLTKEQIEQMIDSKVQGAKDNINNNNNSDLPRSGAWQRTGTEGGGKADAEKHIRDKQVVAFGFDGSGSAEQVVEDLKNLLNQIVGERSGAVVLTTTGSTKFGVIEFTSIQSKVSFWKKVRDKLNDDEDAFGE
eukprot:4648735-Pyramimonas_sp.AAC.1